MPVTTDMHVRKPAGKSLESDIVVVSRDGKRLRLPQVITVKPKEPKPNQESAKPDTKTPDGQQATTQKIQAKKPDDARDDAVITTKDPRGEQAGIRMRIETPGYDVLFWTNDPSAGNLGWLKISGTTFSVEDLATPSLVAALNGAWPNVVPVQGGILYRSGNDWRWLTRNGDAAAFACPVVPAEGTWVTYQRTFEALDRSGMFMLVSYNAPHFWGPGYYTSVSEVYWVPATTRVPQRIAQSMVPSGNTAPPDGYLGGFTYWTDMQAGPNGIYVIGGRIDEWSGSGGWAVTSIVRARAATFDEVSWDLTTLFQGTPTQLPGGGTVGYGLTITDVRNAYGAFDGAHFGLTHGWNPDPYPIPGYQQQHYVRDRNGISYLANGPVLSETDGTVHGYDPVWQRGAHGLYHRRSMSEVVLVSEGGGEQSWTTNVYAHMRVVRDDTASAGGYLYLTDDDTQEDGGTLKPIRLWRYSPGGSIELMSRV